MKELEELSLHHWPALQTIVYDGWLLRFAKGYTKRANSIQALYPSTIEVEYKIAFCEQKYTSLNQPVVYKLTSFSEPSNLDGLLEQRGYELVDSSSVLLLDLAQASVPSYPDVEIERLLTKKWLDQLSTIQPEIGNQQQIMMEILRNILAPTVYISLKKEGQVIGCGFGVIENGYIGLYDIYIAADYRHQGYGKELLLHLLAYGQEQGAKYSYLQVVQQNKAAMHLYQKLGYKEMYSYWYRVKG